MRVGVLSKYAALSASTRYRFLQYAPGLAERGIQLSLLPFFDDAYLHAKFQTGRAKKRHVLAAIARRLRDLTRVGRFDLLWVHSELLPYQPAWAEALLGQLGVPYVYDLDDAIFHQYDDHPNPWVRRALGGKIGAVMARARGVTAGSGYLAAEARRYCDDVRVIPTVVDLQRWTPRPPASADDADPAIYPGPAADAAPAGGAPADPAAPGSARQATGRGPQPTGASGAGARPLTIGWIGSPSTSAYLAAIRPALATLAAQRPIRLVTIGAKPLGWGELPLTELPWSEATEVQALHGCDVGIMPLPDTPWARGKCAFKLIQYMACGLPTVSSPVGANLEVVTDQTGLFADRPEAWVQALSALADDPAHAARLGAAGRARVESSYAVAAQLPAVAAALEAAAS